MCVVIAKPKGVQISRKYLRNCYLSNPDGAGFMFVRDKEIVIQKGYFSFELFWEDYKKAEQEYTKSPFVIHFRIATSGGVNEFNCHPFKIDEQSAFAHNGIFYDLPYTDELSDTQIFNNRILKTLPGDWTKWDGIKRLIQGFIKESNSKVVFLGNNKDIWICGEEEGDWFKGSWYSNNSHTLAKFNRQYWHSSYYEKKWGNDETTSGLVELDPEGINCEECSARVSSSSISWVEGYGPLCLDCREEYQVNLGFSK